MKIGGQEEDDVVIIAAVPEAGRARVDRTRVGERHQHDDHRPEQRGDEFHAADDTPERCRLQLMTQPKGDTRRARIPFWRLRAHGVVEEAVRGGSRRRSTGHEWPLPDGVRERMRGLLEPLGFDLARPVAVREPEGEDALEFSQDA